jgi:hypothetical protein
MHTYHTRSVPLRVLHHRIFASLSTSLPLCLAATLPQSLPRSTTSARHARLPGTPFPVIAADLLPSPTPLAQSRARVLAPTSPRP